MTIYRIFTAELGRFQDQSKYKFVASFQDPDLVSNYIQYMRKKRLYQKSDIIIKTVEVDGIDNYEGKPDGVITVLGEFLPAEEYRFF